MKKVTKQVQTKRAAMFEMIKQQPGITSGEIAERLGMRDKADVSNALWKAMRSGRIVAERVMHQGRHQNSYYMADDLPPDAAERIQQRTVEAKDALPLAKAPSARNSVFDIPGNIAPLKPEPRRTPAKAPAVSKKVDGSFACAVTSDGSLVLMREGQIEFSLSGPDAATLQSYLVKRAAANLFASMA